jgi:type II secretory pathway component PulJ
VNRLNNYGDTIVEVLLSMSVLSAVLFGSWAIINKATQINIASRQRIVMVNQLKEQAEIIKNLYASDNNAVISKTFNSKSVPPTVVPSVGISDAALTTDPCEATRKDDVVNGKDPSNAFYLDQVNGVIQPVVSAKTLQQSTHPNAKVWVQLNDNPGGYIDFYVRACWETNDRQGEDSSQLVMRLNK